MYFPGSTIHWISTKSNETVIGNSYNQIFWFGGIWSDNIPVSSSVYSGWMNIDGGAGTDEI